MAGRNSNPVRPTLKPRAPLSGGEKQPQRAENGAPGWTNGGMGSRDQLPSPRSVHFGYLGHVPGGPRLLPGHLGGGVMGRVVRPVLRPFPVSRSLKDARRLAGSLAGWTPLIRKLLTCVLNPTPRPFARGQNQELLRRPAERGKHDFLFRSS